MIPNLREMTSSNIALLFQHRFPNSFKSSKTLFDFRHISSAGPPRHECEDSLYSLPAGNRGAEPRSPLSPLKARVFPLNGKWRRESPGRGKMDSSRRLRDILLCRGFKDEVYPAYPEVVVHFTDKLSDTRRNPSFLNNFLVFTPRELQNESDKEKMCLKISSKVGSFLQVDCWWPKASGYPKMPGKVSRQEGSTWTISSHNNGY